MKTLLFLSIIVIAFLFSCKKSASGIGNNTGPVTANSWGLVQVHGFVGPNDFVDTPAADSAVLLMFRSDNTYISLLNGQTVCQGYFSVGVDSFMTGWSILQLTDFETTGLLFSLKGYYLDGSGQLVLSDTSQMFMNISHDTIILSPDYWGYDAQHIFVFLKQ